MFSGDARTDENGTLELECPTCGSMVKPLWVMYSNSKNDEHMVIRTMEYSSDGKDYDRFQRAVDRLTQADPGVHYFSACHDADTMFDVLSYEEFEQYVDAWVNGREWVLRDGPE